MIRRLALCVALTIASAAAAADRVIVQSTTSTANSGLYDHLVPLIETATGHSLAVVAVGTGQAIRNAWNCDGDILLVHSRADEEAFVADGGGVERHDLMVNDFVLVGPRTDPAGVTQTDDVTSALTRIAARGAIFASRGDDSGTHKAERTLWQAAGIDPETGSGAWYRETGSGMGATLNVAAGMNAYALTDRATWVSFGNKGDLTILVEGDPRLLNQYGIILVDPERCPSVPAEAARDVIDWLLSPEGQAAIAAFRIDGEQLFFPNAAGRR